MGLAVNILPIDERCELIFPDGLDIDSASMRGYVSHVTARMSDGSCYPLYFTELVRLGQDIESQWEVGARAFFEIGLVVVPEITVEALRAATMDLLKRNYFAYFRTITEAPNPWDV
jgi:hypothetical protein